MQKRARHGGMVFALAAGALLGVGSCQSDRVGRVGDGPDASVTTASAGASVIAESAKARDRIEELRARFRLPAVMPREAAGAVRAAVVPTGPRPVIADDVARGFELRDGYARPEIPAESKRGVMKTASVELPMRASDPVRLADETSRVAVTFALGGASDAAIATASGIAVYARAFGGADVVHRAHAEGTEDFVVFESKPEREEIAYDVDVSHVAGLRLVSNTVEFLDAGGTPRLRIAPPYVVGEDGRRHEATLALDGCAYDTSGLGPWGRAVTRPGAARCTLRLTWSSVAYPALVDPGWTATGSMSSTRTYHTTTALTNGLFLTAGGQDSSPLTSAELYDQVTGTFAATGAMSVGHMMHTATLLPSGDVLMVGGYAASGGVAELYQQGTGTFVPTGAPISTHMKHVAGFLPSLGKVLIATGYLTSTAELYDPIAGTFAATGSPSVERSWPVFAVLGNGKLLVAGGLGPSAELSTAELYDPGVQAFVPTGSMSVPRQLHAGAVLATGKVLIAGGQNGGGRLSTAEIYDPGSGAFAPTGAMTMTHAPLTATTLGSGAVLIVGGNDSATDLYDPMTATFGASASVLTLHLFHTATLLSPSLVVVTGGFTTAAEVFASKPAGQSCTRGADCVSGLCDEGFCCAAACPNSGVCQSCVAGTGACATVTSAEDPDTCAVTRACDPSGACKAKIGTACGINGDCLSGFCLGGFCASTSCATDADCGASGYCNASSACVLRKAQSVACNQSAGADCKVAGCADCATGHCVDGVCCESACTTSCYACAASLQEATVGNGLCRPAKDDTNPHSDVCPVDAPSSCGHDGKCNGGGACRLYYPPGTSCGASACTGGNKAAGDLCNGSGVCAVDPTGTLCDPYLCTNGGCPTSCTLDTDCIAGDYCKQGACVLLDANGIACANGVHCKSGICVDGVCCNGACTAQCAACDVAGAAGSCTAVTGAPHGGRAACAAGTTQNPCAAAQCNGIGTTSCDALAGALTTCGPAPTCANGQATHAGACDGSGGCKIPTPSACGNFACTNGACSTTCASDADCAMGNRCDAASKQCINGATCNGNSVHPITGADTACDPYKCVGAQCLQQCTSVADCVAPAVCDTSGACVAPPQSGGNSAGCSISTESTRGGWPVALLGAAVLGALRRRRRG